MPVSSVATLLVHADGRDPTRNAQHGVFCSVSEAISTVWRRGSLERTLLHSKRPDEYIPFLNPVLQLRKTHDLFLVSLPKVRNEGFTPFESSL